MGTPYTTSIFQGRTPIQTNLNWGNAANWGHTFIPLLPGYIHEFKFYKGSLDAGEHTASLWASGGSLLATATFNNESADGWQSASFIPPYPVYPGVIYVASYFMPSGSDPSGRYSRHANLLGVEYPSSSYQSIWNTQSIYVPRNGGRLITATESTFPSGSSPNWFATDILFTFNTPEETMSLIKSMGTASIAGVSYLSTGNDGVGRYMAFGLTKSMVEGSPTAPSLELPYPGMWRFRYASPSGSRSISVKAKQFHNTAGYRPSMVVKANPLLGINNDLTATASLSTDWVTIGPITMSLTGTGSTWVELRNNDNQAFYNPCYFDTIITT